MLSVHCELFWFIANVSWLAIWLSICQPFSGHNKTQHILSKQNRQNLWHSRKNLNWTDWKLSATFLWEAWNPQTQHKVWIFTLDLCHYGYRHYSRLLQDEEWDWLGLPFVQTSFDPLLSTVICTAQSDSHLALNKVSVPNTDSMSIAYKHSIIYFIFCLSWIKLYSVHSFNPLIVNLRINVSLCDSSPLDVEVTLLRESVDLKHNEAG